MKYIKKNAKELSRGFDCEYDKPSVCPHCGLGTDGQVVSSDFVDFDNGEKLVCGKSGATAEICRSAADLISAPEIHAGRIIKKF